MKNVRIGTHIVGQGHRPYVIAEAGVNHNGDIKLAKKLIDVAKDAAADAVKFQTFTPEEVVSTQAPQAEYQKKNTGTEESQSEMLAHLALSYDTFRELKLYSEEKNIDFLSTPFSQKDADFLASIGMTAFKVSSGDLTNLPYLAHMAKKERPIILSTGMATLSEIREAITELRENGAQDIVIMQCTSEYPSPPSHVNLRVMDTLRKEFDCPVGFSDHTEGIAASVSAASLGASVIEKHFTTSRALPGPDHRASLEPIELKEMIAQIRARATLATIKVSEELLGSAEKKPTREEASIAKLVRRGITARTDIETGEVLTEKNLCIIRPEGEIHPKEWHKLLGRKAAQNIPYGTSLTWAMLAQ